MTSPVDIANQALAEIGQRVAINSFQDGTPASNAAAIFYTPKVQLLLRSARWDFARAQAALSQYKAAIINGVVSANPPPQPWNYEYLWPSDCLKMQFIQPTLNTAIAGTPLTTNPSQFLIYGAAPTAIPFVPGTDFDANGNPIKVILTNVYQAQGIYVRDLSQTPDLWDAMFTSAATALLGSYFINALARNAPQMQQQIAIAKNMIDSARTASANESISNVDHQPDWISARYTSSAPWAWGVNGPNGLQLAGWESCSFPDGSFY